MRLSLAALLHYSLTGMELKIWITEHAHLRSVETFDFGFLTDAKRCNKIADLEPNKGHHESKHNEHRAVNDLHNELREVTVEQPANTVGAVELHHLVAHYTIPSRAVFSGRKYADRQHAPQTVGSVD